MPWTTKLLVIANRTIESELVHDAIVRRAAAGPVQVMLVAPASSGGGSIRERRTATAQRLAIYNHCPCVLQDVWDPRRFDEIIVATLPTEMSRWMATDLPHRVERFTGARVTHIVSAG